MRRESWSKGRGSASNAAGRYEPYGREAVEDGWFAEAEPAPQTEVSIERPRKVITRNRSPDVPFDRSINPYRGCEHGCVYCFARPTHAWLGLSPGLDFETRLVARPDAPKRLRKELSNARYRVAPIALGTNTDPYQPVEKRLRIMRGVLETLSEFRHPVTIVTKGALIARDADILGEMGRAGLARAAISLTTLDHRLSAKMEPRASAPQARLRAMTTLREAGCPVSALVAPVIPGLNAHEIEALLEAGRAAGADQAGYVTLRLPLEVSPLFQEWLAEQYPDRAERVMRGVRALHGGRDYDPQWGKRQRGEGVEADLIRTRFQKAAKRLGLNARRLDLRCDLFAVPGAQMRLL